VKIALLIGMLTASQTPPIIVDIPRYPDRGSIVCNLQDNAGAKYKFSGFLDTTETFGKVGAKSIKISSADLPYLNGNYKITWLYSGAEFSHGDKDGEILMRFLSDYRRFGSVAISVSILRVDSGKLRLFSGFCLSYFFYNH
jgi:hypothetical protein